MNRRTKIIVSVAGIFIVLLALLGLTYAYFLTRINPNTNEKSISVTTADLKLDYGEDTSEIISKSNIQPGITLDEKTFSATNNGTAEVQYAVVFENIVNTFTRKDDVVYTLTCTSSDGTNCNGISEETTFPSTEKAIIVGNKIGSGVTHNYTLKVEYKEMDIDQSIDMGKSLSARVNIADPNVLNPYISNKKLLAYNIINNAAINKNGTELRATPLTIPAQETSEKYNEIGSVASNLSNFSVTVANQGKTWTYGTGYEIDSYTGKITLTGVSTCKYNEGNCPSKIKDNYIVSYATTAIKTLNYIYKVEEAPAASTSNITLKVRQVTSVKESAESTMSFAPDDWGTSYYFRGDVEDNYLELNDMCFRIVRIQGDGSIKLTLAKEGKCNTIDTVGNTDRKSALINNGTSYVYGYDIDYALNYKDYTGDSGLYTNLTKWFDSKFKVDGNLTSAGKKLKEESWCLGGKTGRYNENTGALMSDADIANQLASDGYNYYNYETGTRLWGRYNRYNPVINHTTRNATYRCVNEEGSKMDSYIGTLTADEVVYAGGAAYDDTVTNVNENKTYYLYDNAQASYWLVSPFGFDRYDYIAFVVYEDGHLHCYPVSGTRMGRPAVTLASGSEIDGGDGTIGNPYIIK